MIRSIFGYFFKNKLAEAWKKREQELRDIYIVKQDSLVAKLEESLENIKVRLTARIGEVEVKKRDLEDIEKRVEDRKKDLEKVNNELRQQIRLIEAKSSPDSIWAHAFSQGFSKAWDMMVPLMTSGLDKVKEKIREQEIEAALPRIESVVEQRLKDIGSYHLIESHNLEAKKRQLSLRLSKTDDLIESGKIETSLRLIDWVLGGRNGN